MPRYTNRLLAIAAMIFAIGVSVSHAQVSTPTPLSQAEALVREGTEHVQSKQYDKAVEAFKSALRLDPNSAAAHQGLGGAYVNMGRDGEAVEPLRDGVRLDSDNAYAHLNLGIALSNLRRAEALPALNEARRLAPRDPRVLNEVANAMSNAFGKVEETLAIYKEARRLAPEVPAVHHNIGLTLMKLGRVDEAVAPLEEAIRLNPAYASARYHLSNAYNRLGRYEAAVESWGKLIELQPRNAEAYNSRAWNLMYAGARGEEAAADARKFLDLAGWRADGAHFMVLIAHLGYRQAGRDAEARAVLDMAAKKSDTAAWAYPIIKYMRGELSGEELLNLAQDNGHKTEAHVYIGLNDLLRGDRDAARKHFAWAKEYGNKSYFEYPLALAELARTGN